MAKKMIFLMSEEGVSEGALQVVQHSIIEVLKIASSENKLFNRVQVVNWGYWCSPRHLLGNLPRPFMSMDWYLNIAREKGTDRINTDKLYRILNPNPKPEYVKIPHFDHFKVVVLKSEIVHPFNPSLKAYGTGRSGLGACITTKGFTDNNISDVLDLKTIAMHEVGHMFGLIPRSRSTAVEESSGLHCTNRCIMRQGKLTVMTSDRIRYGEFCPDCKYILRAAFRALN
ncbi:MAG: hypothetical protein WC725_00575 [Patescibacteria group bacterium]|jgi:hypothetical protein